MKERKKKERNKERKEKKEGKEGRKEGKTDLRKIKYMQLNVKLYLLSKIW